MSIAFLSRAKPQDCDALEIFLENSRVFLGYPLPRLRAEYNPEALCTWMVNPSTCPEDEWNDAYSAYQYRNPMHATTRNLIREVETARVTDGAIVVIPRQQRGCVFVGRISHPFEIVCAPTWGAKYLNVRAQRGLDTNDEEQQHIADVAQGWRVTDGHGQEGYRRVDIVRLPGWLQSNLFGRTAIQRIKGHPLDQDISAYSVLQQILAGQSMSQAKWTLDLHEIGRRMVESLNPSSLEHLVVSLLQLKYPKEIWRQVGGPGDGGVDGIGSNEAGQTVGILQVKFRSVNEIGEFGDQADDGDIRRYLAILLPHDPPSPPNDSITLLNHDWIARTVQRHWRNLPQALSMRVGETP